jgi:N-formylglutamate deformylase
MIPVILHIPHASTVIPNECLPDFVVGGDVLSGHLAASTDHFTDELFAAGDRGARTVIFPISRLVVDPERFEDDAREPMASRGLGVLYERGHDGQRIRREPPPARRDWYLDRWYRPHHAALEAAVDESLRQAGHALIIDCHSFPEVPLPVDLDQAMPRPDGCVGTAGIHTPPWLVDAALRHASESGWSFGVDRPYAGTIVPMKHFGRDARVMSIMIEINRKRYMTVDGSAAIRSDGFPGTRAFVSGMLDCLSRAAHTHLKNRSDLS